MLEDVFTKFSLLFHPTMSSELDLPPHEITKLSKKELAKRYATLMEAHAERGKKYGAWANNPPKNKQQLINASEKAKSII